MTTQTSTRTPNRSRTRTRTTPRAKSRKPKPDANVLDSIHASQEAAVDMTKRFVDSIGDIVPDLWSKPILEGAPAIQEISDAAFDLTRKVLDAEIEFTRRLVDSVRSEVEKLH